MAYVVFGFCAVLFAGVVILAVKVIRENRKMAPGLNKDKEEEPWD